MGSEQFDMLEEQRPSDPTPIHLVHQDGEPSNMQVVNAIAWAINKLRAEIVRFSGGMETRAGRIEERLARIEEDLATLHEEKGRAAQPDKHETP